MNERHNLKQEALAAAEWRGHKMSAWVDRGDWRASTQCRICGAGVAVNVKPPPNGIDIGGRAVAVGCISVEERRQHDG